jgi:hypothetical protein
MPVGVLLSDVATLVPLVVPVSAVPLVPPSAAALVRDVADSLRQRADQVEHLEVVLASGMLSKSNLDFTRSTRFFSSVDPGILAPLQVNCTDNLHGDYTDNLLPFFSSLHAAIGVGGGRGD